MSLPVLDMSAGTALSSIIGQRHSSLHSTCYVSLATGKHIPCQDKVAIARLVIRAGNSPSLVALLPQLDEDLDPGDWRVGKGGKVEGQVGHHV